MAIREAMPVSAGVASSQLPSAQGCLSQFGSLLVGERLGPPSTELRVWGGATFGAGLQQAHCPASGAKPEAALETCVVRLSSRCQLTDRTSFFQDQERGPEWASPR